MSRNCKAIAAVCAAFLLACMTALILCASYPRPYRSAVEESGVPPSLAYAVMKAESNFREDAVSRAGAVGVMQIKPSTAEYICRKRGIPYCAERLTDGEYNAALGCMYLAYLLERFPDERTAVCAYNAGEGTVKSWLARPACSQDGRTLSDIPFPETRAYEKKVENFRKIYEILY